MADISIRPATSGDLAAMFRVQLAALGFDAPLATYGPDGTTALMRHGVESGSSVVAVRDGKVVGLAVGLERDGAWFLGELFVLPGLQETGLGRRLIEASMPAGIPIATLSTEDYRAHALYVRAGMTPRWPSYALVGDCEHVRRLPETNLSAVEADPDDSDWMAWDSAICGRERAVDITFLRNHWGGVPLWLESDGERTGYAQVSFRDRGSDPVMSQGTAVVGPAGARTPADARECLIAAVQWAAGQPGVQKLGLDVPGPHSGLPALFDAGFRIDEVNVFFASQPERFGDPRLYVPATGALY